MNPIKRPPGYIYNVDKCIDYINNYYADMTFIQEDVDLIFEQIELIEQDFNYNTKEDIKNNFIYFLYQYTKTNKPSQPLIYTDGGKPANGFEFLNKKTGDGYGIYHCHLSEINSSILIWYPLWHTNGFELRIEYISPHPSIKEYDRYIKNIYDNVPDGFHLGYIKDDGYAGEYFSKLHKLLSPDIYDMNEKIITKFIDFSNKK